MRIEVTGKRPPEGRDDREYLDVERVGTTAVPSAVVPVSHNVVRRESAAD